ncbi:MAG: hypothetical protein HOO96_10200 [Polyangiaceae bacterium]|nr:hypothetical protein [Polyangiaceae bacterium]
MGQEAPVAFSTQVLPPLPKMQHSVPVQYSPMLWQFRLSPATHVMVPPRVMQHWEPVQLEPNFGQSSGVPVTQ